MIYYIQKGEVEMTNKFWETVCYIGLALCIIGQITVGKVYLFAQFAYLIANTANVVRDFAIKMPRANKVRDIVFTAITVALIITRLA